MLTFSPQEISAICFVFPNCWIYNAMIYFFMVWGLSYVNSKGACLTLLIPNVLSQPAENGRELQLPHWQFTHNTRPSSPTPQRNTIYQSLQNHWELQKEILSPFLRIRSTTQWDQQPVKYEARMTMLDSWLRNPGPGLLTMFQQRTLRHAGSVTSGQCI